jgi:hypothetical protein
VDDLHEEHIFQSDTPYYRQYEGHQSMVRRRRSSHGGRSNEKVYDSIRHGIGSSVSDVSEELAKARSNLLRTTRAMKNMEQELATLQASIGMALDSLSRHHGSRHSCPLVSVYSEANSISALPLFLLFRREQGVKCFNQVSHGGKLLEARMPSIDN